MYLGHTRDAVFPTVLGVVWLYCMACC